MCLKRFAIAAAVCALTSTTMASSSAQTESADIQVPAFTLPFSSLASEEARRAFIQTQEEARPISAPAGILEARARFDALRQSMVAALRPQFRVAITEQTIGGVIADVVTPEGGVSDRNRNRVLINLHGGGFVFGARYEGQVAAIPIASIGRFKVITVDYRMAPEYQFPAASEDVAKVYTALLEQYRPENIGIFGCSAGAMLTAESVAWFQTHDLPRPGAIGLDSGGALAAVAGDSLFMGAALGGQALDRAPPARGAAYLDAYFTADGLRDPLQSPVFHQDVLSRFPPTLLMTATRDPFLSSVVFTHSELVRAGADAELHAWEGVGHYFTYDPNTSEARQAYAVMINFFDRHLGVRRR